MAEQTSQMSPQKEAYLRNELHDFTTKITNLRLRVIFMSMFFKVSAIEPYFNLTFEEFAAKVDRPLRSIDVKLLYLRVRDFQRIYDRVMNIPVEQLDVEEIIQKFPYLGPQEAQFVETFRAERGYYPMFFLLEQRLSKATRKEEKIFAMFYGIGKYRAKDRRDIAQEIGLSSERVRLYLGKPILKKDTFLMRNPDWNRYDLMDEIILTPTTSDFEKIAADERLSTEFEGFLGMVGLLGKFTLCKIWKEPYAIAAPLADAYNWEAGCRAVLVASKLRYEHDTDEPFESVLPTVENLFPDIRDAVFDIMATLAYELFGIETQQKHRFHFTRNSIDETRALIEILDRNGIPMHLRELLMTFNTQHPKWALDDVATVKKLLNQSDDVYACGYSGMYASHQCADPLEVYDVVENIVRDMPDYPVPIDEIMDEVHQYYPSASRKSVEDLIFYYEAIDVVPLEDNYYAWRDSYKGSPTYHSTLKMLPLDRKLEYLRYARDCRYRAETFGKG